MKRLLFTALLVITVLALASVANAQGNRVGPPGGVIYAHDVAYRVIATPNSLPDNGNFDTLYTFPDCPDCASVSEAAPGDTDYNGGRWRVVAAFGITEQLTNAEDVLAAATSIVDTGTRFSCPLVPA
jgi:hypothetical protein